MNEKNANRINTKIGKMQAKEMKQVANEKTLAKNLSSTRQKLINLEYLANDEETMRAQVVKHLNYCAKHRKSALMDYDATSLKREITIDILQTCVNDNGINVVRAVSILIGILDKKRKELERKQQKELAKLSK